MKHRLRPKDAQFTPVRPAGTVRAEALSFAATGGEDLARLDALLGAFEWEVRAGEGAETGCGG